MDNDKFHVTREDYGIERKKSHKNKVIQSVLNQTLALALICVCFWYAGRIFYVWYLYDRLERQIETVLVPLHNNIANAQAEAAERQKTINKNRSIYQQMSNTCHFWREEVKKYPRDPEAKRWARDACQRASDFARTNLYNTPL